MSSADPSAVPAPERRPETAAVDGVMPSELLIEILLLLPPKDVCRVRAVCPSWRALTYDSSRPTPPAARARSLP
ncbi:hypothetical protein C2845_PM03G22670 [Panicum miliaceum]|uniref:F-box domain-containing protein n=1 Tax=Panicum miliaceum TaxID=4540 RepID=A0A3L6TDM6_PANMI|nr:hypothetical protein C2845_PM03G22670 [Panicum miliaceum]